MSSQDYPEPNEDDWEREYAYYLERRMEEQYWEELESQYEIQLAAEYEGCLDDEEVVIQGLNNSEMSFTVSRDHTILDPSEYNTIEEDSLPHRVLHTPMEHANATTIGEYLGLLLTTLWVEAEGFSGKRPFGNSGWQYDIYIALGKAGLVDIQLDEDGYVEEFSSDEQYKADDLILQAIKFAFHHG